MSVILKMTRQSNAADPGYGFTHPTLTEPGLKDLIALSLNLTNSTDPDHSTRDFFYGMYFPEGFLTAKRAYGQMVVGVDAFYV